MLEGFGEHSVVRGVFSSMSSCCDSEGCPPSPAASSPRAQVMAAWLGHSAKTQSGLSELLRAANEDAEGASSGPDAETVSFRLVEDAEADVRARERGKNCTVDHCILFF